MKVESPVPIAFVVATVPGVLLNPTVAAVLLIAALIVVLVGAVKLYDLHRKRQADAVHLQAQVSDALLRDARLFGLPITATADVSMMGRTPPTVTISGQVPNEELRRAALRIAEEEAARIQAGVVIEDRMLVVPTMAARAV